MLRLKSPILGWLLAVVFSTILVSSAPSSVQADVPDAYAKARTVARTEIWKDINSGRACSASVTVMDRGTIVYSEGFAMADREKSIPVDQRTLFNIGSISKVYTATAIMLLVDDGKVKLDAPVTTYLPDFVMADPRYKDITVRMLLNHTSGLPGTTGSNNFGYAYNTDVFRQTLANLAASHLKHPPGTMAPYTNDGFTLAEMIVEFLSNRVFKPLGLNDTAASIGQCPDRPAAAYYQPDTGKREPREVLSVIGAGGLGSTTDDICRFEDMFSGSGTPVLSAASLEEMKKAQPPSVPCQLNHDAFCFGLGWDMTDLPSCAARHVKVLGKSGGTGRYTSMMFTAPDQRLSVAVVEAAASGRSLDIAVKVLHAVLVQKGLIADDAPPPVSRPPAHEKIPAQLAAYAGYYAPFLKIAIDFEKNVIHVTRVGEEKPGPGASLFYHGGYFYDPSGHQSYFITRDGQKYYVACMSSLKVDAIRAQKLPELAHPKKLDADINGRQWLLRTAKPFYGISGISGHIMRSHTLGDLPGYVEINGFKVIESPVFAGMPASAIRDQSELTLIKKDGTTWARISEDLFSPVEGASPYRGGTRTVTIASDGYSEWLKTGAGLILNVTRPARGRVVVFAADGTSLYDSITSDGNSVYAPGGSFVELIGDPGQAFEVQGT